MSLDLYDREIAERMSRSAPVRLPEVGVFDGFIRGTAMHTMRGLARAGSAIDLLGSVGPIIQDAFTGGTEAQDRYFREHDEIFGSAIDFWTPKPREVGAAAEVTGQLISTIAQVLASPSLAVGTTFVGTSEDLVKKGVDSTTALAVGGSQGLGLGLGIYMPIFGQTLAQRVLLGGMGFNVAQGVGMRAAGEMLLKGTPAEGEFEAFDPAALTLDALLGAAFGGLVHLSPTQRAQGAKSWERMKAWAQGWRPSDVEALAVLRQAQHLNVDSLPGKPADPVDVERHVARVRQAVEQVSRDQPVDVSDLPQPRFEADEGRLAEMASRARELAGLAEDVRKSEGLPPPPTEPELGAPIPAEPELPPRAETTGPREEVGTSTPPAEGEPFLVYRFGDAQDLANRNAGNADAVARHIMASRGAKSKSGRASKVYAYEVRVEKPFGEFEHLTGRPAKATAVGRVTRGTEVAYSFPESGWQARELGVVELSGLRAKLKERGFKNFEDAGRAETVRAMRELLKKSEAPAANRGEAEPPPPRGRAGGEAAGAEGPDPLRSAAETYAAEHPDQLLTVGNDADGRPIITTVREYLEEVKQAAAAAREDMQLFEAAAHCMLGRA